MGSSLKKFHNEAQRKMRREFFMRRRRRLFSLFIIVLLIFLCASVVQLLMSLYEIGLEDNYAHFAGFGPVHLTG
jgi:hypothetical protein